MGAVYRSRVLESLFERGVVAYEHHGVSDLGAIYEEEAKAVSNATESRRQAFTGGRLAARSALKVLGIEGWQILSNGDRAPIWPNAVVGSITHTDDFCAAVVASKMMYSGLGIDAEGRSNVSFDLWELIFTSAERKRISSLPSTSRREVATAIFSAKESFFKCQYQLTGSWLGFDGAEVKVGARNFTIRLIQDVGPLRTGDVFAGRFILLPNIIVTGIGIACDAPSEV